MVLLLKILFYHLVSLGQFFLSLPFSSTPKMMANARSTPMLLPEREEKGRNEHETTRVTKSSKLPKRSYARRNQMAMWSLLHLTVSSDWPKIISFLISCILSDSSPVEKRESFPCRSITFGKGGSMDTYIDPANSSHFALTRRIITCKSDCGSRQHLLRHSNRILQRGK